MTRAFNLADTDGFIRRVEKNLNKETSHTMLYRYGTKYASRRPQDPRMEAAMTIGSAWFAQAAINGSDFKFFGRFSGVVRKIMRTVGYKVAGEDDPGSGSDTEPDDSGTDTDEDGSADASEGKGSERGQERRRRSGKRRATPENRRKSRRKRRSKSGGGGGGGGGGGLDLGSLASMAGPLLSQFMGTGGGRDVESDDDSGIDESRAADREDLGLDPFDDSLMETMMDEEYES